MKYRIYYENTDAGGVVYHSNYLNFCERARSELFFQNGISPHKENEFFVVKSVQAEYVKPAVLGDIIDVKSEIIERKATSMRILQNIYRGDELLFKANFLVVYLKDFKPARIPKEFIALFKEGKIDV